MGSVIQGLNFLVQVLFELYVFILILRLVLTWVQADYYHPISQFVIKLTDPVVIPLKKILPVVKHVDVSTILVLIVINALKIMCLSLLNRGNFPFILGWMVLNIADIAKLSISFIFYAIIIRVILSWINSDPYHPVAVILYRITDPIMEPFWRVIPPISGIDLSPIAVLIALQLLNIVLISPIYTWGAMLA